MVHFTISQQGTVWLTKDSFFCFCKIKICVICTNLHLSAAPFEEGRTPTTPKLVLRRRLVLRIRRRGHEGEDETLKYTVT